MQPHGNAHRVCLFEDSHAADLEPLSLTRPVFDLLCGMTSLGEKQCREFNSREWGVLIRPYFADLCRFHNPNRPVNDLDWLKADMTLLINGRWRPGDTPLDNLPLPCVGLLGEEVAFVMLPPDELAHCSLETLDDCLASWKQRMPVVPASGHLIRHGWELVEHNAEQLRRDFRRLTPRPADSDLTILGPHEQAVIEPSAQVEPMVLLDTRRGPIVIERDAVVAAFSRIEGPCYIGPRTQVHGAKLRGGVTLGPDCRIGGEVEASIVHGYSNKAHDGFLGHSYVGEWVNLGAGTHNSDLRNDYGVVTVTIAGRRVPTRQTKVGCLLGDHTKTGLGTLLNTGSNIGAFCNLLPGGLLPRYMPSFSSWWNSALTDKADLPALLETASMVMARRGQELTDVHRAVYGALFDLTATDRRRAIQDARLRRFRRSA
jgi:UDP-N-acetylglucosamine diphosphorylase/glucosamine-1-phosphate N-acetyltransferase